MAKLVQLNFDPDTRTLRQFGWLSLVVFGALGFAAYREAWLFSGGLGEARTLVAGALLAIAAVSGLFSAVFPKGNKALFVGLSVVAFPIGFVLSYVILGVLFFFIIAPVGVLIRLFGMDPMQRRFEREQKSYWSDARPNRDNASYFKQY